MSAVFPALGIFLMALISPGADFSITLKNSLVGGRKAGVLTALGISLGNLIHITYIVFGLGVLLTPESKAVSVIKIFGAMYLIYLGIQCLRSKPVEGGNVLSEVKSKRTWFYQGLMTNLLNANCPLFMIAVFATLMNEPKLAIAIVGIVVPLMCVIWFSAVSFIFSIGPVHRTFMQNVILINRCLGVLLIAFALKLFLS